MKYLKTIKKTLMMIILITIASSVSAQIKILNVGDQCPKQLLDMISVSTKQNIPHNAEKAILIDFWATWCSPCLASFPMLDSLQQQYRDKLTIVSVTRENENLVNEVIGKVFSGHKPGLTILTRDSLFNKAFPHQSLPHYVWINSKGIIKGFSSEVSNANIQKLIDGQDLPFNPKKHPIDYNVKKPFYATKQVSIESENELLYHSMVSHYRPDLINVHARGKNFITSTNTSILYLFQLAFGKFDLGYLDINRLVAMGFTNQADSVKIGIKTNAAAIALWKTYREEWAFNYELMVPENTYSNDQLFEMMQQDLNRFFYARGIRAYVEKRKRKVVALVYSDDAQITSFKESAEKPTNYFTANSLKIVNRPMSFFLSQVKGYLPEKKMPLINETGYKGKVNIEFTIGSKNMMAVNKELDKYGLEFVEKDQVLDMIVIEQRK